MSEVREGPPDDNKQQMNESMDKDVEQGTSSPPISTVSSSSSTESVSRRKRRPRTNLWFHLFLNLLSFALILGVILLAAWYIIFKTPLGVMLRESNAEAQKRTSFVKE